MTAHAAVTIGCRVVWLVTPVAMPTSLDTAAAAPVSDDASFTLKRSEMNTDPSPSSSAARVSTSSARGSSACPANP